MSFGSEIFTWDRGMNARVSKTNSLITSIIVYGDPQTLVVNAVCLDVDVENYTIRRV